MKRSVATVVLALSVGLAACDDRSQAAPEVESPSVPAAEPAREAAPAAAPPAAATPAATTQPVPAAAPAAPAAQ